MSDCWFTEFYQVVVFGPPGAGKSHRVHECVHKCVKEEKGELFSTCFHPEYKYGDFAGRLLPYTVERKYGQGADVGYKFFEGDLTRALRRSYEIIEQKEKKVFLVIDEINRGNASAIFGKFFNLLDRNEEGWSRYEVNIDELLCDRLFPENTTQKTLSDLKREKKIKFPPNFHIIATMNTGDESIFYLDNAFKRRWEWIYVDENEEFYPLLDRTDSEISHRTWLILQEEINKVLKTNYEFSAGKLEEKLLGKHFITNLKLASVTNKITFHLWDSTFRSNKGNLKYFLVKLEDSLEERFKALQIPYRRTNNQKKEVLYKDTVEIIKK